MKKALEILGLWKEIFGNWKYVLIVPVFAALFYALNALISNFGVLNYSLINGGFSKAFFLGLGIIYGFSRTILPSSFATLMIIGVLTGLLISIMAFNFIKNGGVNMGLASSMGLFFGVIAPGCAACGIGLAGLLGLTAALTSLPFQGLEISALAIGLLFFSVVKTSANIINGNKCLILRKDERGSKIDE